MKIEQIYELATRYQWVPIENIKDPTLVSFTKIINAYPARVNVWYSTMTVGTALNHPKQGKTQLFRKWVSATELDAIFKNPRVHSNKGYK